MKIAFFTNNYKPFVGGVPIAVENLAVRLRKAGHRVFIFAPEYEEQVEDEPDVFRITALTHFNETGFSLPLPIMLEAQSTFADAEPDLVHVHHPFLLGSTGLSLARSMNLPVVFTYHTQYERYAHYLPFGEEMVGEVAQQVAWRFANCCDAVIAPSSDIRDTLVGRGVTVPIRVIPTGVDLMRFRRADKGWLRGRFGLGRDERVLLFVSRLAREKNVDFLIRAFARLAPSAPDSRLVLVGGGDAEEELRRLAAETGLGGRILFAGTLSGDDLVSAYAGADMFVFASTSETQGMVVLEAMAAGQPVVAVRAPGVRDVVADDRNGFMVDEGDEEGFAARVLEILGDDALRARLQEGAKATARSLSLPRTVRRVERLYQHVLRHRRQRREELFLMLKEFVRYQWQKLREGIDDIIP